MQRIISASLFLHPGFLIVDHIHFQYNGFMYGILLWSLLMARNVSRLHYCVRVSLTLGAGQSPYKRYSICCATEFQTHIHVHGGAFPQPRCLDICLNVFRQPAYFVYLLRVYCMSPSGDILPVRFLTLANAVILVFLLSLGPFVLMGQLPQLLSRLFPFTRGLNHAYWAPNAWALVTALDRVLLKCGCSLCFLLSVPEGVEF